MQRRQRPFQKRLNRIDEPRPGSKQAIIVTMLSRKSGATLEALVEGTGWLPHTTRAALTRLRKRGYTVVLERQDGKPFISHRLQPRPTSGLIRETGTQGVSAVNGS